MKPLSVAIIGCGGVGRKRAIALPIVGHITCCDSRIDRATDLATDLANHGRSAGASANWRDVVHDNHDIVIVSTTHDMLAPIAIEAIRARKKAVLIEKPGATSVAELDEITDMALHHDVAVRIGFNHRYHPSVLKAFELQEAGVIGNVMMVRGRYGHGGRIGYENEWRADPAKGGGELMDQGVHLIDLSFAFLEDSFRTILGRTKNFYWDMPVEDNAFMILETRRGLAHLHVSCTEWKNTFSFEIYGTRGKLHIEGLGGSYGLERLSFYRMLPQMGPPDTTIWEYPRADESWKIELEELFEDVRSGSKEVLTMNAREALRVVEEIRLQSAPKPDTVETA